MTNIFESFFPACKTCKTVVVQKQVLHGQGVWVHQDAITQMIIFLCQHMCNSLVKSFLQCLIRDRMFYNY